MVLKALSKNPVNRYQSAAEMRSDLVRVRSGQSPLAPAVLSEDERTAMLSRRPAHRADPPAQRRPARARHRRSDYDDDEPPRSTGKVVGVDAGACWSRSD